MYWRKICAGALCMAMLLGMTGCNGNTANTEVDSQTPSTQVTEQTESQVADDGKIHLEVTPATDAGNPLPFRVLSVDEMVAEMGTGWNLGNTMDGHSGQNPNETLWQDDKTTQELITAVHDLGFNTIRIPVTWGTMIEEDNTINDKWISRVQDIVDYAISQDMYVIINIHHDGADNSGWLNIATDDLEGLYAKFGAVWNTIATRFRDYDEHLIFESMNEVYGNDEDPAYDTAIIMDLNQIFVNTVRSSGSNNEQRWLSVPGRYTNIENMTNDTCAFALPEDTVENRLFAAVHYYDWNFGMLETMATVEFKSVYVNNFLTEMEKVVNKFTSNGIPVIMGEYGAINKNNPQQRAYHNELMNLVMQQAGVVPVYWDQGWYDRTLDPADYSFTLVDRKTYQSIDKEVTDALMRGFFSSKGKTAEDVVVSPEVIKLSSVALSESEKELTIGDVYRPEVTVEPAENNDVLLWKTSDANVATVYNGMIRARGIGTATITAFSQSGSVSQTITVTVKPLVSSEGTKAITTSMEAYTLEEGTYTFMDAVTDAADENVYLTYLSKDEKVATISKLGKLTATGIGTTEVVITSADGVSKTVSVTVTEKVVDTKLNLALYVLFNDEALAYYGTEEGDNIEITGDGQYTLTFDFGTQASDAAKAAGVKAIENLTAIYIKDKTVMDGELEKSIVSAAEIRWDKIVVDGKELTIVKNDFKSALKSSGIFDTNDPFNSWDGSAVEETTSENHVLNINMENPQKVSITFTIQGLTFVED